MKNSLFSIMTTLFVVLTFTSPNSISLSDSEIKSLSNKFDFRV